MSQDRHRKDIPGVIAPPPLIYLAGLVAGLVLDRTWTLPILRARPIAGTALVLLGAVLMALGIREFKRAGTDFKPYRPTTRIITSGPFRFTRNPLYISLALVYAGIALTVGSAWALAFLVPVLGIIRYGVIAREERYLEGKFGPEYLRYKQSVRRWL
ncbi:MAG TPA: isoprenylcysteine carboxylmethyltransferase family protein [Alphaproteobacteria bacterium]|nr:isoprenylcysteine carboxylmethyltransferase family protein [Alphaproteobacteria bacterium]